MELSAIAGAAFLLIAASACGEDDNDAPRGPLVTPPAAISGASGGGSLAVPMGGSGGSPIAGASGAGSGGSFAGMAGGAGMAGTAGSAGMMAGIGGMAGVAGRGGMGGMAGMAGRGGMGGMGGSAGSAGSAGSSGSAGGAGTMAADGETGRLVGITAAHNKVRAMVMTTPALAPMTWSNELAEYAQQWADMLKSMNCAFMHRSNPPYGENIATFGAAPVQPNSTAQDAVDGWAGEVMCWTYGTILGTEKCPASCYSQLSSDGCGHYTQIVWRSSTEVGCGFASCTKNGTNWDLWVCNYRKQGNIVGQAPY